MTFIEARPHASFHVFRHTIAGEGHSGSLTDFSSCPDKIAIQKDLPESRRISLEIAVLGLKEAA